MKAGLFKKIFQTGLLAGTLDIAAAILILAKGHVAGTFKFIASGAFGEAAFSGGAGMVAWGVFFHFLIATSFAALFFLAYPYLPFLKKNKWINGLLYGGFVWAVMNLVVLPLSLAPQSAFNWAGAIKNMAILSLCIGLPIAWMADRFYVKIEK